MHKNKKIEAQLFGSSDEKACAHIRAPRIHLHLHSLTHSHCTGEGTSALTKYTRAHACTQPHTRAQTARHAQRPPARRRPTSSKLAEWEALLASMNTLAYSTRAFSSDGLSTPAPSPSPASSSSACRLATARKKRAGRAGEESRAVSAVCVSGQRGMCSPCGLLACSREQRWWQTAAAAGSGLL